MGQHESNLRTKTENELTTWQRLWRINCGMAWAGKIISKKNGIIKLANPRPFFGTPAGTPDMIGFDSIIITPEMVGKRVAVFTGSEIKATKYDKLEDNQIKFKNLYVKMGGIHREHREECIIESGFLS